MPLRVSTPLSPVRPARHDGGVISVDTANRLRLAGLAWRPAPGDRFVIPDRGMDEEVFVISTMTVDLHDLPDGQVIGFNGTVEWALDSLSKDEALWLPREDQLRERLAGTFRRLERGSASAAADGEGVRDGGDAGGYRVVVAVNGVEHAFEADDAEAAYASALHFLITGTGT